MNKTAKKSSKKTTTKSEKSSKSKSEKPSTEKVKNKSKKETPILSPMALAKQHKKEQTERMSYRFPEGRDFTGKLIEATDTLTSQKGTPCYELKLKTKEKNNKGERVDVLIRFFKNQKALMFFYSFLELAGADLSQLDDSSQDSLDEGITKLLETLEDENPEITFNSVWQKDSSYNTYYITACEEVLANVAVEEGGVAEDSIEDSEEDDTDEAEDEEDDSEEDDSEEDDSEEDDSEEDDSEDDEPEESDDDDDMWDDDEDEDEK